MYSIFNFYSLGLKTLFEKQVFPSFTFIKKHKAHEFKIFIHFDI